MTVETRAAVAELMRRIATGGAVEELFAEPVDWLLSWPAGPSDVPWIRPRHTRADVADHFRALAGHHVPEKNGTTVSQIVVDGPEAVVFGEIVQTLRRTGREYRSPFALRLTVTDGLITRYHIYEDSLTVARAVSS